MDIQQSRRDGVELMGLFVDRMTEPQVCKFIVESLHEGRGGVVVTVNLDHLRRVVDVDGYRDLVSGADLVVADGQPLVWASKIQGDPLPARVAGSDLVSSLTSSAADGGKSIFLLGGNPGAAEGAAGVLQRRHPELRVAGWYCPPMGFERDPDEMLKIQESLQAARPDIVYVALGSPKQEILIRDLCEMVPGAWWLGVGISLSFLTGEVDRAPVWLRRIGLEWFHRLLQEPGRLGRRYLIEGIPFAARLAMHAAYARVRQKSGRAARIAGASRGG